MLPTEMNLLNRRKIDMRFSAVIAKEIAVYQQLKIVVVSLCFLVGCTTSPQESYKKGMAYYRGNNVAQDIQKASSYFVKAAKTNYANSACYVFDINHYTFSHSDQVYWLKRCGESGRQRAYLSLGYLYEQDGPYYDRMRAYKWYFVGKQLGYKPASQAMKKVALTLNADSRNKAVSNATAYCKKYINKINGCVY